MYPQRQQSKCGGQVIGNTLGGDREGSREPAEISARASQGFGCAFCHWCRKNVPRNGQWPFACDKATQTEQSPSWAGWERRREGKPAPGCSACKAPRGRKDGEYQKIVVSYLVLIPLLASCPGSTIHGRLARVFCSEGSICFERERLMPVMWYLYGGEHAIYCYSEANTAPGGLQSCCL